MNLGELLELLREGILNDRTDRVSGTSDYLWKDKTLVTYINEAQRRFAVKGLILRDASTREATQVVLVAGQEYYPLHPAVISVMSAKAPLQGCDLARVGHSMFSGYRAPTERWLDPAGFTTLTPGPVLAYSTDEAVNDADGDTFSQITLRVYPVPTLREAGQTIRLRVIRKPLEPLRLEAPQAVPEIPEDHHIEMLDWAAYLALRVADDDSGNLRLAQTYAATFEDHVAKARKLAMMKMFAPQSWGFGRGGFSWSND